jgi:hypothetical protein
MQLLHTPRPTNLIIVFGLCLAACSDDGRSGAGLDGDNGIVTLTWNASDADAAVRYEVRRGSSLVATVAGTAYTTKRPITQATRFSIRTVAPDGQLSSVVTLVARPPNSAPSAVGSAWATVQGATAVTIGWTPATDDRGVKRYRVRFASGRTVFTRQLSVSFRHLKPGRHALTVVALDGAGAAGAPTTVSFTL